MSANDPLDLSEIDPRIWRVLVQDDVYGPYTLGQVRSFVEEGRVTPQTMIARGDGAAFAAACDEPRIRPLFETAKPDQPSEQPAGPANHVIILQTEAETRDHIIAVLNEFGEFSEIMSGVFLLSTSHRTAKLREALSKVVGDEDHILIVNASDDRLAWLGLRPDIGEHVRTVWKSKA